MRSRRLLPTTLAIGVLAIAASFAAAAPASADHRHQWWDEVDAEAWSGAGAGWNGSSWRGSAGTDPGDGGEAADRETATWTPVDTREVEVRSLEVDRAAISPNGDAVGDAARVEFRLRRSSAPVSVRAVDAAGATVRQLGELRDGTRTGSFSWDGTNAAGAVVPDGDYRIVLTKLEQSTARHDQADPLAIDVAVDTQSPSIATRRPTLAQLGSLARRAGELRDARRLWEAKLRRRGGGNGNGHGWGNRRHKEHGNGLGEREREWVRLWESRQLRLPVAFTTAEEGEVEITARVGAETSTMQTWRAAGSHEVDVVLPTYAGGSTLRLTFASEDPAGNLRRHTVVAKLPAMPKPRPTRRSADRSSDGGGAAPVTGVPTSGGGPFPDWLDPIMLRATYGAGVPQSWARSQSLSNLVLRESSYRPTAQNPTSTAYGLFQFLDQTWATVGCRKTSDAYQQSVCGLRYVQRRYGTPERAWAFWQANHWY